MVCLNRPYPFKFFKGCLPQILLGPFLNTLSQMSRRRPGYLLNVLCAFSLRPVSKGSIATIQILIHTTNFEKIFSASKYRSMYETKPVEPSTLRSMQIFNFLFNFRRYLFYHHFAEAVAQSCSVKKVILRNFAKRTGKHLYQSLFINQVAGRPATLLKKRL